MIDFQKLYDYLLDNIYIFCLLIILILLVFIFLIYLIRCSRKAGTEEDYIKTKTNQNSSQNTKTKEELEKITDEEIEARVLEEVKKEEEEVDKKLDEIARDNQNDSSIEELINSLKDAKPKTTSDALKKFEDEQEEQAIISYQQLVDSVTKGSVDTSVRDNSNDNLYESYNETEEILKKFDDLAKETEEEPILSEEPKDYSYKPNEFISPVFGRMDSSNVRYREGLSYTDKKEKEVPAPKEEYRSLHSLDELENRIKEKETPSYEIRRTKKMDSEEFLNNLKEFRRNL